VALATHPDRFDYDELAPDTRAWVEASRDRIRERMKRSAEDIVEIGRELVAVKEGIGHGRFLPWLRAEFGWSVATAQRFMQVAGAFPEMPHRAAFDSRALYLLAAGDVPDEVRERFVERAASGERVTHQAVVVELRPQPGPQSQTLGELLAAPSPVWQKRVARLMAAPMPLRPAVGSAVAAAAPRAVPSSADAIDQADPDVRDNGNPGDPDAYATGTDWMDGLEADHAAFLAEHVPPILGRIAAYRADPAAREELDGRLAEYVEAALRFLVDFDEEGASRLKEAQRREYLASRDRCRERLEWYVAVSVALGRLSLPGD